MTLLYAALGAPPLLPSHLLLPPWWHPPPPTRSPALGLVHAALSLASLHVAGACAVSALSHRLREAFPDHLAQGSLQPPHRLPGFCGLWPSSERTLFIACSPPEGKLCEGSASTASAQKAVLNNPLQFLSSRIHLGPSSRLQQYTPTFTSGARLPRLYVRGSHFANTCGCWPLPVATLCFLHMNGPNPHNNPPRQAVSAGPFHRPGNRLEIAGPVSEGQGCAGNSGIPAPGCFPEAA